MRVVEHHKLNRTMIFKIRTAFRIRCRRILPKLPQYVVAFALTASVVLLVSDYFHHPSTDQTCIGTEKRYDHAAVVSDSDICSAVGRDILEKKGGSAVDATIATLLCLGLAVPHSTGIGGNFIATLYESKTGKTYSLDARYAAPLASNSTMFGNSTRDTQSGVLAILIPSEVAGYKALHDRFGRLPWRELFQSAIRYCYEGFPTGKGLYDGMVYKRKLMLSQPDIRNIFLDRSGRIYPIGYKIRRPKLGRTLAWIAERSDDFYRGTVANDLINDIRDMGGIITHEDLRKYTPKWREPARVVLKNGFTIHSAPPPGSGAIFGYVMKVLDGYNMSKTTLHSDPALVYHRMVETWKFAFAKRFLSGDMDFTDQKPVLEQLLSPEYAQLTRTKIDDHMTHEPQYYGDAHSGSDSGTSHLIIRAANGDIVTVTASLNNYFGCKKVGERTGILFNSGMDDFATPNTNSYDIPPSEVNLIQPGKRPVSSISPTIITDQSGQPKYIIGASGGTYIITGTTYVAARLLYFGESLKEAIDSPRVHHQWLPNRFGYEPGVSREIWTGLQDRGHKVVSLEMDVDYIGSNVQMVQIDKGQITAYADKRKGGCPAGY